MVKTLTKYILHKFLPLFICGNAFCQQEIFKSNFEFSNSESSNLVSSFTISENEIIFNACDFSLYGIKKNNFETLWKTYICWKTDIPPILNGGFIFHGNSENGITNCYIFNLKTGEKLKKLPFGAFESEPFFDKNIVYGTALLEGGHILAYDLKDEKLLWRRFIAHGTRGNPYYLKDKIIANAEGDNWFEINYDGKLTDTTCLKKASIYVNDIPCVKNFRLLSHDKKEITDDFLAKNKIESEEIISKTTAKNTFVITETNLLVLKDKIKKVIDLDLYNLNIETGTFSNYMAILKADENEIWFVWHNNLLQYDFKNNKLIKTYDLVQWNPHQLKIDGKMLWLISKNDGQLYALKI